MRIAVSGTHGVGKSTLIDEFLRRHPEFVYEPEPYTVLVEDFGEEFGAEPCVEDFRRQLEFNLERLGQHTADENVIYERCPLDFLAYIAALDQQTAEKLVETVKEVMQQLEVVVYLPLAEANKADEFPKLQRAVDRTLSSIFREDEFGIMSSTDATVVEAEGSTDQRLRILENYMLSKGGHGGPSPQYDSRRPQN
ncbi:MAG TPA: AAA family ATPase [Pyrinomonadaceae bacterium]|nr:AAA family ATPase [Pyrinomonadaceae bacterium]